MALMNPNPFRPAFGVAPPSWPAATPRSGQAPPDAPPCTPVSAALAKTVMLIEAETQARQRGWVVVSETAVPGVVDRLTARRLPEAAAELELSSTGRRVTAVALPS